MLLTITDHYTTLTNNHFTYTDHGSITKVIFKGKITQEIVSCSGDVAVTTNGALLWVVTFCGLIKGIYYFIWI